MALRIRLLIASLAACSLIGLLGVSRAFAGASILQGSAVGGVSINAEGIVANPSIDELNELQRIWQAALDEVPAEMDQGTRRIFISLRKLEEQIARHRDQLLPLPEAVQCLAGLQRVEYVLVYPEANDIVLAGPAEGWTIDRWGTVVGKSTGRPVVMLDDLMAALRARRSSADGGLSCSIDPTPEGVARLRQLVSRMRTVGNPQETMALIEQALGDQVVTVSGVPETSHFARVMVAADFRMKRLAMNFEPPPVDDLPSFLHLMNASRTGLQNLLPRWWLAPNYEPLRTSPDGLAWQIRGQGVRCVTEDDYFAEDGTRTHTGKSSKVAQQWADLMTSKFEELASKDSAFGQLRNIMDLAVVAALIEKEQLLKTCQLSLPRLLEEELLQQFNAPKTIPSQASFVKKGRNYLISASGGVQFQPWEVVAQSEESETVTAVRTTARPSDSWWWD
jgi:hypothetical protein